MKSNSPSYSISLRDKSRSYNVNISSYPVTEEIGRNFYYQFIPLWGKKVSFKTTSGETVEGYLHKVQGDYKTE